MSNVPEQLRAQQLQFAHHLRDPSAQPPPPGLEDRRLAVYRELFFNNVLALLSANFPVIRQILGEDDWQGLVRAFHAEHRSQTPLFTEIGREFLRYLETRAEAGHADPPWLAELAHYEWVELALQISDAPIPPHDPEGDLLDGIPVASPTAWALAYQWPVHQLAPGHVPADPPATPTLLMVRRDGAGKVRFAQISPLVYRLFELLGEGERSGRELLLQLAAEAGADDPGAFVTEGEAMLVRMREERSVLGIRP